MIIRRTGILILAACTTVDDAEAVDPSCLTPPLGTLRVGASAPPSLDCLPFSATRRAETLDITGYTREWRSGRRWGYAEVSVFDSLDGLKEGAATFDTVSGGGAFFFAELDGYTTQLHWVTGLSGVDPITYALNVPFDVMQAAVPYDPRGITRGTLDQLAAAVGATADSSRGAVIGRTTDCANRPLHNAVVSISPWSGSTCSAGASDVTVYYFADGPENLPDANQASTPPRGDFFIPNIPPGSYAVRVWGFADKAALAQGAESLQLVSEFRVPVAANGVYLLDAYPTESSGSSPSSLYRGSFAIRGVEDLDLLSAFTGLTGLLLIDGTGLTDLSGLGGGLASIGGCLSMSSNAEITSLAGLDGITDIGGDVFLVLNTALADLDGLSTLQTVGSSLFVVGNTMLSSIEGLYGLTFVGGDVSIINSPALPTCQAEALRETLRARGFQGSFTIEGTDDTGLCP